MNLKLKFFSILMKQAIIRYNLCTILVKKQINEPTQLHA